MRWTHNDTLAYQAVTDAGERVRKMWDQYQAGQAGDAESKVIDRQGMQEQNAPGANMVYDSDSGTYIQKGGFDPSQTDIDSLQTPKYAMTGQTQYKLGSGDWQGTAPTQQDVLAARLRGMANYHLGKGNTEEGVSTLLKGQQLQTMGLQQKHIQGEIDAQPTQLDLQKQQLEAARLKQEKDMAVSKGLPGLMEFHDKHVNNGRVSRQVTDPKTGAITFYQAPQDNPDDQSKWTKFGESYEGVRGADGKWILTPEAEALAHFKMQLGDDKVFDTIAQAHMRLEGQRQTNELKKAMYASRADSFQYAGTDSKGRPVFAGRSSPGFVYQGGGQVPEDEAVHVASKIAGRDNAPQAMSLPDKLKAEEFIREDLSRDPNFQKLSPQDRNAEISAEFARRYGTATVKGATGAQGASSGGMASPYGGKPKTASVVAPAPAMGPPNTVPLLQREVPLAGWDTVKQYLHGGMFGYGGLSGVKE